MTQKLNKKHLSDLSTSFITPELAEMATLQSVDSSTGIDLLGRQPKASEDVSGLIFPYIYPENNHVRTYRIRLDNPFKDANGKQTAKYLGSFQTKPKVYFAPNTTKAMIEDSKLEVVIGEGEKKLLAKFRCATNDLTEKPKFLAIGLQGVWSWKDVADFNSITWKGRKVSILFDADVTDKPQVAHAEKELAKHLKKEGAKVFICRMPKVENYKGIDDLLAFWAKNGVEVAINSFYEMLETSKEFEADKIYLSNDLVMKFGNGERNKIKLILFRNDLILHTDELILSKAEDREKFTKKAELTNEEKTEVNQVIMELSLAKPQIEMEVKSKERVQTSFQVLQDGRIIEQIRDGFALYNPETKEYLVLETVTDSDGITYEPIDDEIFQKAGGLQLANDVIEYGSERELITEIENYLSSYLDLKPLFLKLTALYILFTYIFDRVLELSYLNATGDPGSGKSRFGSTVCFASRRGLSLITPSAASLYRIVDKFKPTLFIDEFNSDANSDDSVAVIQILNAGFQQTAQIPRQVATGEGQFRTEMFDPYCPKIIGSLKQSASNAFNSRCIEIQMERTTRNDIPLRLSRKHLQDAQNLRNKLTLWRLRNFQNDFEARLDEAEVELQKNGIIPRSIQINIPLFALITDVNLKRDFINLLKGRDVILTEEKRNSIDGELVQTLHNILFDIQEDGTAKWSLERWNLKPPEENLLCEDLRIEKIVSMMNHDRKERDQLNSKYIGKKLSGLGLRSSQILSRKSDYHKKSAVSFDAHRLGVIFRNYGLPVPSGSPLDQLDQNNKSNQINDFERSKENLTDVIVNDSIDQANPNETNNNGEWSNWSKDKFKKSGLNGKTDSEGASIRI